MEETLQKEALQILVRLLRDLRGWGQPELAAAAGMNTSSICHYETGKSVPPRRTLARLAAAVDLPISFVDSCLLPAIEAACGLGARSADLEKDTGLERTLTGTIRSALASFLASLEERAPWERDGPWVEDDRQQALDAWSRLEPCTPEDRLFLVEFCREFQTWALAELLCQVSKEAAPGRSGEALELARLAQRVAELAPGRPQEWHVS